MPLITVTLMIVNYTLDDQSSRKAELKRVFRYCLCLCDRQQEIDNDRVSGGNSYHDDKKLRDGKRVLT